jgi:predicted DNA-binding mobile mystery protein A
MNTFKNLQLHVLDQHLRNLTVCDRPKNGWVKAIRTSLGMTVQQLALRLGISQQSATSLEQNEATDAITIHSLRKIAMALDCKFVYALVPNQGSLENTIRQQAYKKARELLTSVDHSMQLELQGVGNLEEKIAALAEDLVKNANSNLWEDYAGTVSRRTDTTKPRRAT